MKCHLTGRYLKRRIDSIAPQGKEYVLLPVHVRIGTYLTLLLNTIKIAICVILAVGPDLPLFVQDNKTHVTQQQT